VKVVRSDSHSRKRLDSAWTPAWFRVPFGKIVATCFEGIPGLGQGSLFPFPPLILCTGPARNSLGGAEATSPRPQGRGGDLWIGWILFNRDFGRAAGSILEPRCA
jgi:hypothetical protein